MNKIQQRIKELEDRLKSTSKSRMLSQTFAYEAELKGLKFAQQEILRMLDILMIKCPIQEDKECWCKPLEELKKQIKNEI